MAITQPPWLFAAHDAPATARTLQVLRTHIRAAMASAEFDTLRSDPAFSALESALARE